LSFVLPLFGNWKVATFPFWSNQNTFVANQASPACCT